MKSPDIGPGARPAPSGAANENADWHGALTALTRRLAWLVPGLAPREVEDLALEALIDLIRTSRREPVGDLDELLNTLTRRKIVDHARRRARWSVLLEPRPAADAALRRDASAFGGPAQRMAFVILEVLDKAGSSCEPLARAYLAGHEWAEVAAACGRSEGTVERQWSRCVAHVRRILQESPGALWAWAASDEETYHGKS